MLALLLIPFVTEVCECICVCVCVCVLHFLHLLPSFLSLSTDGSADADS